MSHPLLYTHNHIDASIITYTHGLEESLYPCLWTFACIIAYAYYGVLSIFCSYRLSGWACFDDLVCRFLFTKIVVSRCLIVLVRPLVLFRRRC